jgi:hypothetical protein
VRAHLLVDGADAAQLARAASAPRPEAVVLGAWRKAPRRASGYVDFDRVILREAP